MARGTYTIQALLSGVTTARTLAYLTAASTVVLRVKSASVTNANNATNQQMKLCWKKIGTLGTPTATTVTPSKHELGDQAAASTAKVNVTASEPTYTSNTEIGYKGVASLNGYTWPDIASDSFVIAPSASWGLQLVGDITSTDLVVNITFEEIG